MNVTRRALRPGETVFGGQPGVMFLRGLNNSRSQPTEKSASTSATTEPIPPSDPGLEFTKWLLAQNASTEQQPNTDNQQESNIRPEFQASLEKAVMESRKPKTAQQDREGMNKVYGTPKKE